MKNIQLPSVLNRYFVAQMFMTRLPVPPGIRWSEQELASSTAYFPATGLIIGLLAASAWVLGYFGWSAAIAALFAVTVSVLATGAFHEDGLADSADGIGGAFEIEKKLAIMRDSRIGTYGSMALILATLGKVLAISQIPAAVVAPSLIGAHVIARWTSVALIYNNEYVRESGTGKPFAAAVTMRHVVAASSFTLIATLLCFGYRSIYIIFPVLGAVWFAQWYSRRKLGGITGDVLGACNSLIELLIYLLMASHLSVQWAG